MNPCQGCVNDPSCPMSLDADLQMKLMVISLHALGPDELWDTLEWRYIMICQFVGYLLLILCLTLTLANPLSASFCDVIGSGDIPEATRVLKENPALANETEVGGWLPVMDYTPLQVAAHRGNLPMIKLLLSNGADINARDGYGNSALSWADTKAMDYLLQNGADVKVADLEFGNTILHGCAQSGLMDRAEILLKHGLDVNVKNSSGEAPLDVAIQNGQTSAIAFLLSHGATVTFEEEMCAAVARGDIATVRRCISENKDRLEERTSKSGFAGATPIQVACALGQKEALDELLTAGADVDVQDDDGRTALHWAALTGRESIAKSLVSRGAKANAKDRESATPLHYAARHGHSEVLKVLTKAGADIRARTRDGQIALHWAVQPTHGPVDTTAVLNVLIADVTAIDEQDDNGESALHMAARDAGMVPGAARLLLAKGAKANIEDYGCVCPVETAEGLEDALAGSRKCAPKTPMFWAIHYQRTDIVNDLLSHGGRCEMAQLQDCTSLFDAAANGYEAILTFMLDHQAAVDDEDAEGRTALGVAAQAGQLGVAKSLLSHGADIDGGRLRPLQCAAMAGNAVMTRYLLDAGADIHATDAYGLSAIHFAAAGENIDVIKLLIDKGAQVNARTANGVTPLWIASERKRANIVKLLEASGAAMPDHVDVIAPDGYTLLSKVSGDFDADGKDEDAYAFAPKQASLADKTPQSIVCVAKNGKPFWTRSYLPLASPAVTARDLTNDGFPELVIQADENPGNYSQAAVWIYRWKNGAFRCMLPTPTGNVSCHTGSGRIIVRSGDAKKAAQVICCDCVIGNDESHGDPHRYTAHTYVLKDGLFVLSSKKGTKKRYDGASGAFKELGIAVRPDDFLSSE